MPPSPKPWKGKPTLATPDDFEELNQIITYRHILSQNLGVRDPLRVIALCDSDAFYANCEMVRLKVDPETPLVVLQWDAIIAVNYSARKYGISRMDKKKDALKRCPNLMVVHVATYKEGEKEPGYWDNVDTRTHKVSLDYYRRESMKIAALFREELPGCEVEKASIDEAFIDFTKPVREILLQRYPYLAQVPSDSQGGLDAPLPPPSSILWDGKGDLIPVHPPPPDPVAETEPSEGGSATSSAKPSELPAEAHTGSMKAPNSLEESHDQDIEPAPTWHDVALSIAAEMMGKARGAVRTALGYSTSAGISRNKFLAKLTASYKKPNGQSVLRNAAIPSYLKPLPFRKIRFLGGKLGKAIEEEYDASTVGDLLTIGLGTHVHILARWTWNADTKSSEEMQTKFGEQSIWVYEILRGIDRNEVKDKGSALNKSMLASKNLPKPITKPSEGQHWIRVLAAELALRLGDAREMSPNLWPKTLVLHARKGYESGRSKQTPFPFTKDPSVDFIANLGNKLWKELVGSHSPLNVTNVSLAFTGIDMTESGQQSIEGFLKPASGSTSTSGPGVSVSSTTTKAKMNHKRPVSHSDSDSNANDNYAHSSGADAVAHFPGVDDRSTIDEKPSRKSVGKRKATSVQSPLASSSGGDHNRRGDTPLEAMPAAGLLSYTCERCGKTMMLPSVWQTDLSPFGLTDGEDDGADDNSASAALEKVRMEHEDWHFAQDLSREGQERKVISVNDPTRTKVKVSTAGSSNGTGSKAKKRKKGEEPRGLDRFFTRS